MRGWGMGKFTSKSCQFVLTNFSFCYSLCLLIFIYYFKHFECHMTSCSRDLTRFCKHPLQYIIRTLLNSPKKKSQCIFCLFTFLIWFFNQKLILIKPLSWLPYQSKFRRLKATNVFENFDSSLLTGKIF